MQLDLAKKITNTTFIYPLLGMNTNLVYDASNGSMIITDAKTGAPLRIAEADIGMNFDEFTTIAKKTFLDIMNSIKSDRCV